MKLLKQNIVVSLLVIFHIIGMLGLSFQSSQDVFLFLTPYHLLFTFILIFISKNYTKKFFQLTALIFLLGFFLDFIEIAVVVVPIVAPILLADPSANITAVWLGVMIGVNIQTSFLTPPFGFALFYLRGVASKAIKTIDIYVL